MGKATRNDFSTLGGSIKFLLSHITATRATTKKESTNLTKGVKAIGAQTPSPQQVTSIQSKGIHHGLSVIPESDTRKGLTAIVTGANGISGSHMVRVLAESPERWANIYSMSRLRLLWMGSIAM
ncbi:hypothetical protein ACJ72_01100 [Emergomyces africanus]|uniref:NAD-dependent epimerase/dehydratase domain-containing protein n=1 Tax=Emergomyces africanus TaxID=1955775 RepID=A0A1B7P689_9EURO|nr:hypothetical protein ACJ72_01100 [Emergomyces africanus]